MGLLRPIARPYRAAAVAVAISAVVHGAAIVGLGVPYAEDVDLEGPAYTATLQPAAIAQPEPAPVAAPAPKPRPRARPRKPFVFPAEALASLPEEDGEATGAANGAADAGARPAGEAQPDLAPAPEVLALAQPVAPPEPPAFRADALPGEVTISYDLTSVFADGQAEYTWKRDGDRYKITGTAQATGFFTLFLEGRIDQESRGRVTQSGLRPDRFTEWRPSTPEEGLAFDWNAHTVEFHHGDETRTAPLVDNTVDWLSMIFQLAHMPPKGDSMDLRVFTQRRLYQFHLLVLGVEDLDLPFGRAKTLHLRHTGDTPEEVVDVWLGVDQHYLPVKLRYPVAKNRLVVEQTATSVRDR